MKLNSKSLFATLVIASMTTAAFAGMEAAPKAANDATKTATDATKSATDSAKTMTANTVTGKVESVNADGKTFKVTVGEGKDAKVVSIAWTSTTKLAWKNEKMTAATQSDLKVGAPVTVKTDMKDGNHVATEIWFAADEKPVAPAVK